MADNQFLALYEKKHDELDNLLSNLMEDDRKRFLALALRGVQDPKFANCTPESKMDCVIDACATELEIGTAEQLAFLIPYGRQLQFQPSYRGLIKRAIEAGVAGDIYAELVYKNDLIEVLSGSDRKLVHKPKVFGERGPLVGAYALAVLRNGITTWEIMEMSDIQAVENAAKRTGGGKLSPAWQLFRPEMIKKSCIRRLVKRLQGDRSDPVRASRLEAALAADNKNFDVETTARNAGEDLKTNLDDVADNIPAHEPPRQAKVEVVIEKDVPITEAEGDDIFEMCVSLGFKRSQIPALVKKHTGVDSIEQLMKSQMQPFIEAIQGELNA